MSTFEKLVDRRWRRQPPITRSEAHREVANKRVCKSTPTLKTYDDWVALGLQVEFGSMHTCRNKAGEPLFPKSMTTEPIPRRLRR